MEVDERDRLNEAARQLARTIPGMSGRPRLSPPSYASGAMHASVGGRFPGLIVSQWHIQFPAPLGSWCTPNPDLSPLTADEAERRRLDDEIKGSYWDEAVRQIRDGQYQDVVDRLSMLDSQIASSNRFRDEATADAVGWALVKFIVEAEADRRGLDSTLHDAFGGLGKAQPTAEGTRDRVDWVWTARGLHTPGAATRWPGVRLSLGPRAEGAFDRLELPELKSPGGPDSLVLDRSPGLTWRELLRWVKLSYNGGSDNLVSQFNTHIVLTFRHQILYNVLYRYDHIGSVDLWENLSKPPPPSGPSVVEQAAETPEIVSICRDIVEAVKADTKNKLTSCNRIFVAVSRVGNFSEGQVKGRLVRAGLHSVETGNGSGSLNSAQSKKKRDALVRHAEAVVRVAGGGN